MIKLAASFGLRFVLVLRDFASEFRPGASAHRFTKSPVSANWLTPFGSFYVALLLFGGRKASLSS